jgi:hypothetical protein
MAGFRSPGAFRPEAISTTTRLQVPAVLPTPPTPPTPPKVTVPPDPYAALKAAQDQQLKAQQAAQAKADADAAAAKRAAGQRFLDQAGNLEAQAAALKHALETGFNANLQQNLADVGKNLEDQLGILRTGAAERAKGFLGTAQDTEIATAGQSTDAFANLVRERQDSLSQILEHGVGETDALRAMVMSARNFQANQNEGNRAYFDTMRSVNNAITDLNMDTQTALGQANTAAESERERLWTDFYNRRSDSFTQLGNVYGQQRDYYAQAKEFGEKPAAGTEEAKKAASEQAFMDAAKETEKSYVNPGLPQWIKDYKGQEQVRAEQQNTNLAAAVQYGPLGKAEGASSLRRWAA